MSKTLKMFLFGLLMIASVNAFADSKECNGKFANPITDYCWSSVFPIKIAGADLNFIKNQEDKPNDHQDAVCSCGSGGTGSTPMIGVTTSFWEPISMVDVVRKPFCLAGLGGVDLGNVMDAPPAGFAKIDGGAVGKEAFYQVHYYINPILYWLGSIVDNSCVDNMPFDIAYMTEVDPLWNDEEMTTILNPDAFLYANPAAQLACAGDCITTSLGFPNPATYWCAGCQGSVFPLTGKIKVHKGMVESTSIELQKFLSKAHRELMIWGSSGKTGMCYKYPKYLIDRTDYKYSMLFPVPEGKIGGRCSQPLGRTTALWGAGKEFPFYGEDAVYQIFRKRDCCVGRNITNLVN